MRNEIEELRRRYGGHEPGLLGALRSYAVLCPLVERPDGVHLLFEVRSGAIPQGGEVCFNGETCLMRGKKVREGDKVAFDGTEVEVVSE